MSERAGPTRALWVVPVAIFVAGAVLYGLLSSLTKVPVAIPDEFLFGGLARSIGQGDGLTWYGVDYSYPLRLYIYLISPAWMLASGTEAYGLAKLISAVTVCLVVFPVWLLAHRLMGDPWKAAVPALLAIAGSWMLSAGLLVGENLAYPLCTAALACAVLALREPGSRWIWAALGFAVLATLGRAQMIVIFAIVLAAVVLDIALAERPRERALQWRLPAGLLGAGIVVGIAGVLSGSVSVLGIYTDVSEFAPSLGLILTKAGDQWLALAIASAMLPLTALLVLAAQPAAWRDGDLGALLRVAVPAVVLLVLQSGYFNAGAADGGIPWSIERYIQYAIPLLLIALFVALDRRLLPIRLLAIAGGAVALTLVATTDVGQAYEERARYAIGDILGMAPRLAAPLLTLILVGGTILIVSRVPQRRWFAAVGGMLLVALALQAGSIWRWHVDLTDQTRAQFPASLEWVDDNARGPVTRMYLFQNSALFQTADFFNDDVEQVLRPSVDIPGGAPIGPICTWTASPRGVIQPSEGASCRPLRRILWNDDPILIMSVYGGKVLARDPFLGQLISVPANPRLRSLIQNPCQRATVQLGKDGSPIGIPRDVPCTPTMAVNLWLDRPATLELTYAGSRKDERVSLGTRSWDLPAGRRTTIRVPLNEAAPQLGFKFSWTARRGTPKLVDATLDTDGQRDSLL